MLLLDIGNTRIKVWEKGRISSYPARSDFPFPKRAFYYICVNAALEKELTKIPHATNLRHWFDLQTEYEGLGADRIAACYAVREGVVVDAGSAITVDLMIKGVHKGGFILPGIKSFEQSFANISPALAYPLDLNGVDEQRMPQNTETALRYATLKAILLPIREIAEERQIYLCGGDAEVLARYLERCEIRPQLLFEGMQKVIKERTC